MTRRLKLRLAPEGRRLLTCPCPLKVEAAAAACRILEAVAAGSLMSASGPHHHDHLLAYRILRPAGTRSSGESVTG